MKTKREMLERAISASVMRAASQGRPIDVNDLAIKLSSKYPQSGITLDAICGRIEEIVAAGRTGHAMPAPADQA